MKICPYCKSELTDNAQFCLYCMKSLDEKTVLSAATAKKKPLPWILLAFLGLSLAIIIIVLCIVLGKNAPDDKDNSLPTTNSPSSITTEMPTTTATVSAMATNSTKPTANSASEPTATATNPTATATTESTLKPTATVATGTNTSANPTTYTTKPTATATSITKPTVKPTAVPTTKPTVKPTATPTNSTRPTATATTKPTATPTLKPTATPTATPTAVPTVAPTAKPTATPGGAYSYRDAVPSDDFKGYTSITDNAVVVTGIIAPDENGVYYVPDMIDGRKVIAVTAEFSANIELATTVKKIVIPSTVRTVWAGSLSNCVNMTDVYLCGTGTEHCIEFEIKALPDVTLRNFEITFHYDPECCGRDYFFLKIGRAPSTHPDYAYQAKYEEWDPSTPID